MLLQPSETLYLEQVPHEMHMFINCVKYQMESHYYLRFIGRD